MYNLSMKTFNYSIPIDIRYGDLDPQWHVNNSRFLTFLEHARLSYLIHLGLFDGENFFDFNLIVADIHIAYLAPIQLTQKVAVYMRCERIGNKSLTFVYEIRDEDTQQEPEPDRAAKREDKIHRRRHPAARRGPYGALSVLL